MWCTSPKLMPRCSLICLSVTSWSHVTIWTTLAHVSGSVLSGVWPGGAKSSILLLPSLNLLDQSNTAVGCKLSSPYTWMSAGLAPSTQKLDVAALCVFALIHNCPAQSNLQLCTDNTEQPAYDRCLSRLVLTTIRQNKNN